MTPYIDGFVLPVPRDRLESYRAVVAQVAQIWKEHGALDYSEYVLDDSTPEGIRTFTEVANAGEDEVVVFGWVAFESREARDLANEKVATDARMPELIAPLTETARPAFDAGRMAYGGFHSLLRGSDRGSG